MNKKILLVVLLLFVNGCSIKDVQKPIRKFTLQSKTMVASSSNYKDDIIKVAKVKSPKYLKTKSIWYKNNSYEINSYLYGAWNENFSDLIEQNLVKILYDSALFKSVYANSSKQKSRYILESEIVKSSHNVKSNMVEFCLRVYLIDRYNDKLVSSKKFNYEQKCSSFDVDGVVKAYNEIIDRFDNDLIKWIGN